MAPFTACFVIHNPDFQEKIKMSFSNSFLENTVEFAAGLQENMFKSLQVNMKMRTIFYFRRSLWFHC